MKRLAAWIFNALFSAVALARMPDFIIGTEQRTYLMRWWLLGGKPNPKKPGKRISRNLLGLRPYLHCFLRSDDDRALHDHPNASLSLCLAGSCVEHTIDAGGIHRRRTIEAGQLRWRRADFAHRIEIGEGHRCWTLFVFFGRTRAWGFHCPERGWVPWEEFTDPNDAGRVGPGCGA